GVAQDYAKARHCYEQAAAKGNVTALYNLAYLYEFGQGVSINYAKALEYYQKAADGGDEDAPAKVAELREKMRRESE
ncbi:MAG: sel1 repeat family protein, partial [Oscillibacter sp.]|nr:sel1 repeat family protein [Oscillibacter sp.]